MIIQKRLFNQIKSKLDANLRLADVIGELLDIGSDSTYRRIRGDKELSFSELSLLCSHFSISVDALLNIKNDSITFKYSSLDLSDIKIYEEYINNVYNLYNTLLKSNKKEFIITAQDIPIFHFMPYTELTFFKLYAWSQTHSKKNISYNQFTSSLNKDSLTKHYQNIFNVYQQVPSSEVWSKHTISPLINLINYYIDLHCFEDKETPLLLCKQLHNLINTIENWAERKYKTYKGIKSNFNLYLSPVDMQNDFIITKNDQVQTTSLKLFTINAIFSNDESFNVETEKWINQIISKSSLLSGTSERERFLFFQVMRSNINNLIEKINNFIIS